MGEIKIIERYIQMAADFAVAYSFKLAGALLLLVVGLKLSSWAAGGLYRLGERRGLDITLNRFLTASVRLVLVAFLIIIILGSFGISVTPLVAAASAAAFGATVAIQGPLSNYGAGLSLILSRPFTVGDNVQVKGAAGVVEEVTLAATTLRGKDGEQITVPNKQIVGEVIVNSGPTRIVEAKIGLPPGTDAGAAITTIEAILTGTAGVAADPPPQVGITALLPAGGQEVGIRYWVAAKGYHPTLHAVNSALQQALPGRL